MAEIDSCTYCGCEFIKTRNAKIYCDETCSRKASEVRNATSIRLRRDAYDLKRNAKQQVRQCEWCGDDYQKPNKGNEPRFCSKSCSNSNTFQEAYIKRILAGDQRFPVISTTVYRPLCECCGVRFTAATSISKACSEECRSAAKAARVRAVANDNKDSTPRDCKECGLGFIPAYGNKMRIYCTRVCSKRNARRTKRKKERARLRGAVSESVNPITVMERDGWSCRICGIDTPRDKRGTYDADAPEMDHIIPLAKGGSHTYGNVQCACRQCNAEKSDSMPVAA